MSEENVSAILREIDNLRIENKESHDKIEARVATTNGKVADLVAWKIQTKTVLWIFGLLISTIVIPVGVSTLNEIIKRSL